MTPYHYYVYYTLVAKYWYDVARLQPTPIGSVAWTNHKHYDALAYSQFTDHIQRDSASDIYFRYLALGYDAAKYSETWPFVVKDNA